MKRYFKYLFISIGAIFFLVCGAFIIFLILIPLGPGPQDFVYRVSGDYELVRSSAHMIKVVSKDGWNNKTPIIPEKVIEIAWDRQFVLAKRQGLKRRSPDNPNDTYMEPDVSTFDYWILDVTTPQVYGPLTLKGFKNKRMKLSISDTLILKNVYEYK